MNNLNDITRRGFLAGFGLVVTTPVLANCPSCRLFSSGTVPVVSPDTSKVAPVVRNPVRRDGGTVRTLYMRNVNIESEVLDVTFWRNGSYDQTSLATINHFMRDWRANTAGSISREVLDWLYRIQEELELREPMGLVAGFRTSQTNNLLRKRSSGVAQWSLHLEARAIDFRAPGRSVHQIDNAARRVGQVGGIGLYSRSDFVHIDDGRIRTWGA